MKIGLLGGTFNPIHIGHMLLAQECWHQLELDKVIFVPVNEPPHKGLACNVSAADRLNMVRLALEDDGRFEISTFEIDKGGTSYSINTARHFRKCFRKDDELYFLTGADSVPGLPEWKDIDKLLEIVILVVASRPAFEIPGAAREGVKALNIPLVDVSSTMIRKRIKGKEPIDFLVPPRVVKYIREKGLYLD